MQHVYSEIDGWFDFPDVYLNAVAQAVDGARFVEIGAYLGKSAAFMAVEITNSGKRIQFDVVDTWTLTPQQPIIPGDFEKYGRSTYGAFLSNMDKFGLRAIVNPIQGRSTEVAATYEDGSLDFVFIDADHSYDAVRADIAAWLPKVKHRGVLAGHDYDAGTHRAVVLAVDVALPLSQIQRCNRSWVFHNELPTVGHFVVPLSSEPREYLLYIPCVNGPELLAEAVDSVRDHWANLIIIDQSDEGIKDLWDGCIAIYRWTAESHFVRMQNWLQRHAMLERVPYFLFMHHDACCQNNAVQMVVDEARILDRIGERWGVIFTAYDALCLFSTHATIQVGAWDETFRWYVADIDYYNRMTWAGFRQVTSSRTIVQHHVSQTLRRLSPAERAAVEQNHSWAQAHYAHKWGGWNQQETHRIPYGG